MVPVIAAHSIGVLLRTGATSVVGIVLTVGFVVAVNLGIKLVKRILE
ncbi:MULTISPECIES: hypothetical protein [unclassified Halorubrum]|jgi:hypothetical protein|nr:MULTISPECIES: hypothetical protein [unclassified Halorubrum]